MIDLIQNDDGSFGLVDYGAFEPGESDDYVVVDCNLEGCIQYLLQRGCSANDIVTWLGAAQGGVLIRYTAV